MTMNNKEKLMDLAVNIIRDTNIDNLETIDISDTKYDDGSIGVSINLTYPASDQVDIAKLAEQNKFTSEVLEC